MSFVNDISDAIKQLTALDKAIQLSLPDAAKAGADEFRAEATRLAEDRTGKLKGSFGDRPGKASERTALNSASHVVFNTAFYAAPVESGRYKRPFMRPAAANAAGLMVRAMEREVTRKTDRVI